MSLGGEGAHVGGPMKAVEVREIKSACESAGWLVQTRKGNRADQFGAGFDLLAFSK